MYCDLTNITYKTIITLLDFIHMAHTENALKTKNI